MLTLTNLKNPFYGDLMNTIGGSIANYWIEAADKHAKNEFNSTEKEGLYQKTRESIKEIKQLPPDQISEIYMDFIDQISKKRPDQQENLSHVLAAGVSLQNREGPYYIFSEFISILQSKSRNTSNPEKLDTIKKIVTTALKEIRNTRNEQIDNEQIDNEMFKDSFPNEILLELFKNSPPIPPVNKYLSRIENARKVQIINTTGDIRNAGFSCWLHFLNWKKSISSNENTDLFDIHNINIDYHIPYTPYFLNEYILENYGYELMPKDGFPIELPESYELINNNQNLLRLNYPSHDKTSYVHLDGFLKKNDSTNYLWEIIGLNPNIIKLKLDPQINDQQLVVISRLKNLKHLDLSNCFRITGKYLEDVKDLLSLNLSHCKEIANIDFLASMKNLQFLNLNSYGFKNYPYQISEALTNLTYLKNLQYLDLTFCNINSEGIDVLVNHPSLKFLKLTLPLPLSNRGNRREIFFQKLNKFENLQELHLNLDPDDKKIAYLGQLKSLKALMFGGEISELQMQEIAKLSQLQKIAFQRLENADLSITYLSFMQKLESLTILEKCFITEVGLKHLASLNLLQYLDLGGNAINDAGLKCLTSLENLQKNLKYLRINLKKCTGNGLKHLKKLSRLETLELYKSNYKNDNDISWNDLKGLLSILPNLKHIKLNHDLIEKTLQEFPHLNVLEAEAVEFYKDRIHDDYMKKFDANYF